MSYGRFMDRKNSNPQLNSPLFGRSKNNSPMRNMDYDENYYLKIVIERAGNTPKVNKKSKL